MTLISLDEAKKYLRVDSADEDAVISSLLLASIRRCMDVARLSPERWAELNDSPGPSSSFTDTELKSIRETLKVAILYTLGYLYEHREEADHHGLTMTLRSLLFAIREGGLR